MTGPSKLDQYANGIDAFEIASGEPSNEINWRKVTDRRKADDVPLNRDNICKP